MNYREFTERVYNYKHGLNKSADVQTNESIEHSAKGDEWNQHKYKEKIYLGNGTFRYIYDDGTESTGTKPLEYDDPGRQSQRAKPLVDNFNARQATKEQAQGISNTINTNNQIAQGKAQEAERKAAGSVSQAPSDPDFSQARKEAYSQESSKPIPYAQQDKEIAAGKAQEEARKAAGNANKEPITTPALKQAIADTAVRNQAATASGIAAERAAAGTPSGETPAGLSRAMTESEIRANGPRMSTEEAMRQGTASSVNTTRDQQAENILWDYSKEVNTIRSELADAGYDENTIMNLIRSTETRAGGESIIDQLYNYNPNTQSMVFFPGAEVGLKSYTDSVLPALKNMANTMIESKKISDITSKLTPEESSFLEEYYKKTPVTVNDNNVTTWDNVPTQTWENATLNTTNDTAPVISYNENNVSQEMTGGQLKAYLRKIGEKEEDIQKYYNFPENESGYRIGKNGVIYRPGDYGRIWNN